jgi:geranylgeranyl diphosphate synthase type II
MVPFPGAFSPEQRQAYLIDRCIFPHLRASPTMQKLRARSGMMSAMQTDIRALLESGAARTDQALQRLLPSSDQVPVSIHRAMRHSVFAGGKRLRPILCMEAARMVENNGRYPAGVEDLGSAIEMIHTYSLIHDDLPALDNDDLRRGKPTCHVVYGEAIAILAGDALQTLAYSTLGSLRCPPDSAIRIVQLIAQATGTLDGMIGGQVLDLEGEHSEPTKDSVLAIHRAKTGALIRVSLVSGGIFAGATAQQVAALTTFGSKAGLAFQIIDDVLDMTGDAASLGKTAGKDAASSKATWPAVRGIPGSVEDAQRLINEAFTELAIFGEHAEPLKAVARYLIERTN